MVKLDIPWYGIRIAIIFRHSIQIHAMLSPEQHLSPKVWVGPHIWQDTPVLRHLFSAVALLYIKIK
jgi:hypothetical protein